MKRPRLDVNLEELEQIIERGTHAPLSASESEKLKLVLHALAAMLPQPRTTEKTQDVLEQSAAPAPENEPEPVKGHGRNGACSYTGARKVAVPHPQLHAGDPCPDCEKGKPR
jgi:transposase